MFTGLVEGTATVRRVERNGDGAHLELETALAAELEQGDSVAVNGVCLTAVAIEQGAFRADVMAETLRRSSLGPLGQGDRVNVELPLRAGDRMGGHVVQGHVDGTGTVESAMGGGRGGRHEEHVAAGRAAAQFRPSPPGVRSMVARVQAQALEPEIRRVGAELAAAFPSPARHPLRALDEKAMELSARDDALRAALFRFVDVVPACRSLDDLARHLTGYLDELPERPPPLEGAMRVAHTRAGRAALGAAAAAGVKHMAHRFIVGETPRDVRSRSAGSRARSARAGS